MGTAAYLHKRLRKFGRKSKIRKSCPILENNSALDSSHRVICFRIGSSRGLGGTPLSCKGQKHILQYFSGVNNFFNLHCKRQLVTTVPPVPTNNNFTTLPETLQRFLNRCRVGLFQFKERPLNSGFQLLSISGSKKIFVCVHHRPEDRSSYLRRKQGHTPRR